MPTIIDGSASATFQTPLPSSQVAVVNGSILPSMVVVNTSNGFGSTNTFVRRFTNVETNQGDDVTYADSASLGGTFTINKNGVYACTYISNLNGTDQRSAVTKNSILTPTSVPLTNLIGLSAAAAANRIMTTASTVYLVSGDIIRCNDDSGAGGASAFKFTITRVA